MYEPLKLKTMLVFILWIVFSIIVAAIGSDRKVGAGAAFAAALLLSPLIGFIIVLSSERNSVIAHREKQNRILNELKSKKEN